MKVYFSGSIAGGRNYLEIYKKIVTHLTTKGHHVLTEHIIIDNIFEFENQLKPEEIYQRDIDWLKDCDVMIAEVSNPSLGVGFEICYALEREIPTLCVYQSGILVSRMIVGNTSPNITIFEYSEEESLYQKLDEFMNRMADNS